MTANKKEAFPLIIKDFEDSGYDVKYTVLNAATFGVPQKRERVIIVGFRKDLILILNFLTWLYLKKMTMLRFRTVLKMKLKKNILRRTNITDHCHKVN